MAQDPDLWYPTLRTEPDHALHDTGSSVGPRKGGAAMPWSAPLAFDQSQAQVEAMMEQGTTFSDVEDVIEASER